MKNKPLWLKWVYCFLPVAVALLLYFILPLVPGFTEYVVARGVFRIIGFPVQWLMSVLPFSFAELLVILALPLLITLLIIYLIRIVKSQNKKKTAEKGVRGTVWVLSVALLVYTVMHGANFNRIPLAEQLSLPLRRYTAEDLYKVTCDIAIKASAAREKLPEDKNGCAIFTADESEILKLADNSFDNIKKEYPFLKSAVWRVKSVKLSNLWSYTGTTGMYFPWTAEANVNVDMPKYLIPNSAAHEIAHTMGYAREDECNFLAWLACSTSGIADFEYSGNFWGFTYCINALYDADSTLADKAYAYCSEGMLRDLDNRNRYWQSFEGEIMESSQNLNDVFIKVNGDKDGILSYDLMVELLLRYYDKTLI